MFASTLDLSTRLFWKGVGRPVDLGGEHAWLDAPINPLGTFGESWLNALDGKGWTPERREGAGLLRSMGELDGPGFDAGEISTPVRDFYEHTSRWRLDAWSQWTPLFQPAGAAISALFGRRVKQLALPIQPLEVAHGMSSDVISLIDSRGVQQAAAWIRTLKSTGETVFSGCYEAGQLPGHAQPQIHVTFPLEQGNVQVFLTPRVDAYGSFSLLSPAGRFGDPGAYVVVEVNGRHHAARVPIHERFHVYVDDDDELRTDHELRLGPATALHLHYRLTLGITDP